MLEFLSRRGRFVVALTLLAALAVALLFAELAAEAIWLPFALFAL